MQSKNPDSSRITRLSVSALAGAASNKSLNPTPEALRAPARASSRALCG